MKQETNNEIDLLLRRLGRRNDATVSDTDHLDADELSAYVENALPAPARTRYTAHLAECSRCRDLAVQLSSSIGVIAASETAKVPAPAGWKGILAGLFAPMVLRYAVPALGLILVGAIAFWVTRRDRAADTVAQLASNEQQQTAHKEPEGSEAGPFSFAISSPTRSSGPSDKQEKTDAGRIAGPPPNASPEATMVDKLSKDAPEAQPKPEQETISANEPPPQPAASATTEAHQKVAETDVNKKEIRGQAAAKETAGGAYQLEAERERKTNFTRAPATAGAPAPGSATSLNRDDLSANTRTVAGRRFQKKGGVWIDAAYDSSKDVTTLTRGSEQYRALVADEPSIKTIADELEGEIIVVWKGRTYRLRH